MSATNRGAKRIESDHYPTPPECVTPILARVFWPDVLCTMEPCKGDGEGAIQCLLPETVKQKNWCEIREGKDYLAQPFYAVDLTITNPPYEIAVDFLKKSLSESRCTIYLLRLSFLESEGRKAFLSANRPTHLYVLSKRPSFVDICTGVATPKRKGCGAAYLKDAGVKVCPACGGKVKAGTDATGYAWFVWDRGNVMLDAPGVYFL